MGFDPVLIQNTTRTPKSMDQNLADYTDVHFAVVLLSGDEFVYPKDSKPAEARLRAGQDLVFKLGYLLGRLGKQKVFILYHEQKSFLLPTEFQHAIYTPCDKGGSWRQQLIKRLEQCGYSIDKTVTTQII